MSLTRARGAQEHPDDDEGCPRVIEELNEIREKIPEEMPI